MGRTGKFLRGFAWGLSTQGLIMVAGLWLTPFYLFRLGPHDYGLWLVAAQLLTYLGLLDLGVVALLPREIAKRTGGATSADGGEQLPGDLLGRTLLIALGQLPFVLVVAAGVYWLVGDRWVDLRRPLLVLLAAFVAVFPLRSFQATMEGLQELAFVQRAGAGSWALGAVTSVALVLMGRGLSSLAFGWGVTQFSNAGFCAVGLWRRHPEFLPRRLPRREFGQLRSWLASSAWVSLGQLAQVLLSGTDMLIVGYALGPSAVVPYACTVKLAQVLFHTPNLIVTTALPGLAELKAEASGGKVAEVSDALLQSISALSGLIACGILATNRTFVGWWVGPEQYLGLWLTGLAVLNMVLRHIGASVATASFAFGHERRAAIAAVLDGALSASGLWAAVHFLGVRWAPLGPLLGIALSSLPINWLALARDTGRSFGRAIAPLAPWAVRVLPLAAIAAGLSRYGPSGGPWTFIFPGAVIGLLYLGALYPLVKRGPAYKYFFRRRGGSPLGLKFEPTVRSP